MKFAKLRVVEQVVSDVKGHRKFRCICDCGNEHIAILNNLLREITTQCAECARLQRKKSQTSINVKENQLTYDSWNGMFGRCGKEPGYMDITICDEWKVRPQGFFKFVEDLGERPSREYTLDRIDYKGHYTKENCRWAPRSVQSHNKSKKSHGITSNYIGVSLQKGKWVVQIMKDGIKKRSIHLTDLDAAIQYDNISEEWYGDRPNKTEKTEIIPYEKPKGGVSFDKKTNKYRARLTLSNGTRLSLGFFETEELARAKLNERINELYSL